VSADATGLRRAALAALAPLVPVLLLCNGIYCVAHGWFVRFEYGRQGFPPDPFGMSDLERTSLAETGLHSILPWNRDGIDALRSARLPGGDAAFDPAELRHMEDVRRLLLVLLALHAVALVALAALAARRATRRLAVDALRVGAALTLGLFALVGVLLAIDEDWFLTGFHSIFFEGSTWRFAETETLRRLFPDRFWHDTALILGAGAAVQALLVLAATSWLRLRHRPGMERS
jgi:integral membrane protein (TIGR01906 family)